MTMGWAYHDRHAVQVAGRARHHQVQHGHSRIHKSKRRRVNADGQHSPVRLDYVKVDVDLGPVEVVCPFHDKKRTTKKEYLFGTKHHTRRVSQKAFVEFRSLRAQCGGENRITKKPE